MKSLANMIDSYNDRFDYGEENQQIEGLTRALKLAVIQLQLIEDERLVDMPKFHAAIALDDVRRVLKGRSK